MQSSGQFNKKLATIISEEMEGHLWTLQLFGDHDPQVFLNTVFYNWSY